MKLLLLSNSTAPDGGYLTSAQDVIRDFAHGLRNAFFVPFAGVTMTWDDYTQKVQAALEPTGLRLTGAHRASLDDLDAAETIIVGGGNTFQLLKECRARGLLNRMRARVRAGTPYLGWSAGSNLACPTICTTNDMPIVDPAGLDALDLIGFQINPHYTNALPAGHRGETRDQRIAEYLVANPDSTVVGLPEGDWIHVDGTRTQLLGKRAASIFRFGRDAVLVDPPSALAL